MLTGSRIRAAGLIGGVVLLALLYFVAGHLSLLLAIPPGYATAVWPGAGIALAALLIYGYRFWPGVVLGSFLVNLSVGLDAASSPVALKTVVVALTIAIGAGAQALLGALLVQRFVRRDQGLLELRNIVGLLALGGPVSCLVNPTWGVGTLLAGGLIDTAEYGFSWMTWWVGDSIGVLIFLPLTFIWLGKPRTVWDKRRFAVTFPLVLFFGMAVIGFIFASQQEQKKLEFEFTRSGEIISDSLDKHIVRYLEVVHSIQSYFASTDEVSWDQFRTFVGRNLEQLPGIHALSWNPRIKAAERVGYEEAAHQNGFAGFRIMERDAGGRLVPAAERAEYVAVYYIEPYANNRDALGYDVYSQPTRRAALDMARDTGEAVATARITLVQETGSQTGVLVFVPIYRTGRIPDSIADRRTGLLGYAVGVFRLGDVLAAAFKGLGVTDLEVSLFDDSAADDPSPLAVYRLDDRGVATIASSAQVAEQEGAFTYFKIYDVAGRHWRLVLKPDRHYLVARRSWAGWGALTAGLSFASLLGLFLLALTGRWILDERRAEELAEINTSLSHEVRQRFQTEQALFAEKERAEVTLHSIGDAVISTDAEGRVDFLNSVAESLTGWSAKEAEGRLLTEVFHIINEETREPADDPVARCLNEGKIIGLANHTVLVSRTGVEYAIEDSAAPICGKGGEVFGVVLVFKDVTAARKLSQQVSYQASHDTLTGLINRGEFERRLRRVLDTAHVESTENALCYMDLDRFKLVNDTGGHVAGDELLRQLGQLLKQHVRKRDTLARLGGDEFGLLMEHCTLKEAQGVAENIVKDIGDFSFPWEEHSFTIGVSIGLVAVNRESGSIASLLSEADTACYMAKELGGNRVHLHQDDDEELARRHGEMQWAVRLPRALAEERFQLYFQNMVPVGGCNGNQIDHYELLLRMEDEMGNLVPPSVFLPAAERYHLSDKVDRWVINRAFKWLQDHPSHLEQLNICSINLSGLSLSDKTFLPFVIQELESSGIPPRKICFEITETVAIANLSSATTFIKALRELGCRFALDDFGSGLSSFAYLKNLPVDFLKIDGVFVKDILDDPMDLAMVKSINEIGHVMGKQTIAEFVENEAIMEKLREIGVDYAQGYGNGRPRPLNGLLKSENRDLLPAT